jgi:hypothetical protein
VTDRVVSFDVSVVALSGHRNAKNASETITDTGKGFNRKPT